MGPWLIPLVALAVPFTATVIAIANYDPNKWYGKMTCNSCGYRWKSRRSTPPAKCAGCSSRNISTVKG
jgi:rubrerythrin